jgi:preprotein translocase subunit YajC
MVAKEGGKAIVRADWPPAPKQEIFRMNINDLLASPMTLVVVMLAIFYVLLLRPQQKRQKEHRLAIDNLRRGDTVVTAGGIIGKVVKATAKDDPEITIEIAGDVQIQVVKATLSEIRAKGQPVDAGKS